MGNFGLFGGLARLDTSGGQPLLLFSNCDHQHERRNGAVWLSMDSKRWPHKRVLSTGEFGYSSLAAGRPGTPSEGWIYCFFEAGRATRYFESGSVGQVARFNVAWLCEGVTPSTF